MDDLISRSKALDEIKSYIVDANKAISEHPDEVFKYNSGLLTAMQAVTDLPSANPEHIANNKVHLCVSCQYTYVTCPSHGSDALFGDGSGNDNICACNKYMPICAQPEDKYKKGCRNCRHAKYNDHWKTHFCYCPNECNDWDRWEPAEQPEQKKRLGQENERCHMIS